MELGQQSLPWERRTPDWPVAMVAGFAAGAVLMMLDVLWSTIIADSPWRTSHMIAPLFIGRDAAETAGYRFSIPVVAVALAFHYVLGMVYGSVLAAIMAPLRLDSTAAKAVATGAAFGVVLYLVNFHGLGRLFPWLAQLRGWATLAAHLVFGIVAAALYWKLGQARKGS